MSILVDSHCHLGSLPKSLRGRVFDFCRSGGYRLINSGIDLETSLESVALAENYPFVFSSLGFHPFCYDKFSPALLDKYKSIFRKNQKVVALGEIGLDYKAAVSVSGQEKILKLWFELAKKENLTVIIHIRLDEASWFAPACGGRPRILSLLDSYFPDYRNIVFHCFSYSADFLKQITAKKGFVSFSLNVLRKNHIIAGALKQCPLENLLLETDSPYIRVKGNPSSPLDIKSVYSRAAEAKNVSEESLARVVLANAKKLFRKIK